MHFGRKLSSRGIARSHLVRHVLEIAARDGALWNQQAYLAHVVELDHGSGAVEAGLQPLAHFVDAPGPDALAVTVETDAGGETHPALYVRTGRAVSEHLLESGPLLELDTKDGGRSCGLCWPASRPSC